MPPRLPAPPVEEAAGRQLLSSLPRNEQLLATLTPGSNLYVCNFLSLKGRDVTIEVKGEIFYAGVLKTETPPGTNVYEGSTAVVFAFPCGKHMYVEGRNMEYRYGPVGSFAT